MKSLALQRIASGLIGAYNHSLRQHEQRLRATSIPIPRRTTGVRTGRRQGCAAEQFESKMSDLMELRQNRNLPHEWQQETEDALFDYL